MCVIMKASSNIAYRSADHISITMSRTIMRVEDERGDSLLYGYSYLLAWVSFLVSASAAVLFLLASRKRKLLDSDQVNYNNQQLDIEVKT